MEKQDQEALKEFLLDINCLDELQKWENHFNLFDVLKICRTEIRHSNVLSWLLNPNENHNLGDAFIKKVFQEFIKNQPNANKEVMQLLLMDFYSFSVYREWKNIDIIKVIINTVDRLLGRKEGEDLNLITYVTDRKGHDMRYAIDSTKLQKELGWEPSLQFEEGIEKTVKWYLDNQEWLNNITNGEYEKYYEQMYNGR